MLESAGAFEIVNRPQSALGDVSIVRVCHTSCRKAHPRGLIDRNGDKPLPLQESLLEARGWTSLS
jgi:hypothetical protein